MNYLASFKRYIAAFADWLSQPVSEEDLTDPSRLSESLLPVSQLYGFEVSWLRARNYGEK